MSDTQGGAWLYDHRDDDPITDGRWIVSGELGNAGHTKRIIVETDEGATFIGEVNICMPAGEANASAIAAVPKMISALRAVVAEQRDAPDLCEAALEMLTWRYRT